jgi:hypothetical protein
MLATLPRQGDRISVAVRGWLRKATEAQRTSEGEDQDMSPMVSIHQTSPASGRSRRSLAEDLERRRLTHRADRIRRTLDAMHRLVEGREPAPAPLRHGIDDFRGELDRVEQRLRQLKREATR